MSSHFNMQHEHVITTEPAPVCPYCRVAGDVFLNDCYDPDETTCGSWRYRKCADCGSLWLDPRPTPDSIPYLYGSCYFTHSLSASDEQKTLYKRIRRSAKAAALKDLYRYPLEVPDKLALGVALGRVLARLPRASRTWGRSVRFVGHGQGRLLDVGCGNGEFLVNMRMRGWQVFGLEPDTAAAAVARSYNLQVLGSSIEDADLQPNSMDVITLHHVIEHLSDSPRAIKLLASALAPGGIMVSISPNPEGPLAKVFRQHWRALETPRHLQLPTRSVLMRQFEFAGLVSESWTTRVTSKYSRKQSLNLMKHKTSRSRYEVMMKRIISVGSRLPGAAGEEIVVIGKKTETAE
jgi:SAM-dependent methyltransferase